jgi:hypothetical protein
LAGGTADGHPGCRAFGAGAGGKAGAGGGGGAVPEPALKQAVFFKKKNQKTFITFIFCFNNKKFFGSFFQKRTAFFL